MDETGRRRQSGARADRSRRRPGRPGSAEDALSRLVAARADGRPSLGSALGIGFAAVALGLERADAPPWYAGCDPVDLVFLGLLVPERVEEEELFANCRDAWVDLVVEAWGAAPFEALVEAAAGVSERTETPIDDPLIVLDLAPELLRLPPVLRPLPAELLPQHCLPGRRALALPSIPLDPPPADGERLVAEFRAGLELELANDGTVRDVLREGLHVLLPLFGSEPPASVLAAALHLAAAADEHTPLGEILARTPAWMGGLAPGSRLAAPCDLALSCEQAGEPFELALGRLLALPEMTASLSPCDREYHSRVGHRAVALALAQPGRSAVLTRSGTLLRLQGAAAASLRAQQRRFEEAFGTGASGPLFFDPGRLEPSELSLEAVDDAVSELMELLGLSEASRHAYARTGLLPPADGAIWPAGRLEELLAARAKWGEAHGVEAAELAASFEADVDRCARFAAATTVSQARADPELAAELVAVLDEEDGGEGERLLELLDGVAGEDLTGAVLARALEHARAWQGAGLAERVLVAAAAARRGEPAEDPAAALALLAGRHDAST